MAKNKIRLMIIDDDEINNFVLVRLTKEKKLPVSCKTALNGEKGLKKLHRWAQNESNDYPNIILLDLDMPVVNGFEFLDRYEAELFDKYRNSQVYMVSSSIRAEERAKAKSYESVSNFISKPLQIETLEEIIKQYMMTQKLA